MDARAHLIRVLRSACSGELAAIHAYHGHANSVRVEERVRIRIIEEEERHHRDHQPGGQPAQGGQQPEAGGECHVRGRESTCIVTGRDPSRSR